MAKKVQIQLLDEQTGAVIDDANPVTTADLVSFDDGQTFQQKYDAGLLKGQKGDTGAKGATGEGFSIFKTYASVSTMNADAANVAQGKFVLIASDVEDEDNAKLYVKDASGFTYLTDLSGAQGIKGEKGETGAAAGFGTPTASVDANVGTPSVSVTATGTNTSKIFNFVFKNLKGAKGDQGLKGETGAKGATGAAGADGATWLTGTVVPTSAQGENGDWYLNTANYDIYQKASGAWSKKGNIKGATGAKGDQGVPGATGATGAKGDKGDKGDPGDGIKVGTSTSSAVQRRIFFKVIG